MKKLSSEEMMKIKGGNKPLVRECIGIFELEDGRAEYFYRRPDGSVYSVIR